MTKQLLRSHDLQPDRQADLVRPCVTACINLSLAFKQLHWNLRGPRFQMVHEFLDVVIAEARAATDELAERVVTVGRPVYGQAVRAAEADFAAIPDGFITDEQAIELAAERLESTISVLRDAQGPIGEIDSVTEDLILDALGNFEKRLWMLRAHLA